MPFDESRLPGPRRGAGERAINLPPVLLWLIGINVAVRAGAQGIGCATYL